MRFSKWMMSILLVVSVSAIVPALARADDEAAETGDDGGGGGGTANTDHADRTTLTLPSHASDTARANAFGQQGERMKAAHQAARSAAAAEAGRASGASASSGGPPSRASHAAGNAHGANSHAQSGQEKAAAARAEHVPAHGRP